MKREKDVVGICSRAEDGGPLPVKGRIIAKEGQYAVVAIPDQVLDIPEAAPRCQVEDSTICFVKVIGKDLVWNLSDWDS